MTAELETRTHGDGDSRAHGDAQLRVQLRFGVLGLYVGLLIGIALISALRARREAQQEVWALRGRVTVLEGRAHWHGMQLLSHQQQHRHHGDGHTVTAPEAAHVDA